MTDLLPHVFATMPLHTITGVYGEPGLRVRFLHEIAEFPDRDRILDALALVTELHRDDRRVGEPALNHLLRVATRIVCYYRVDDPDVIIAALLHDAVEDHPEDLAQDCHGDPVAGALAVVSNRFGPGVAAIVAAVTNPAHDPAQDRHEQYRAHVTASLEAVPWARVVKVSDFTDNGVGLLYTIGPKVPKLATKYGPLVAEYRRLVARADTPLSAEVKAHIFGQLDRATQRFEAILGTEGHSARSFQAQTH